jgi:putative multiple sugar transport system substrate-binding protein
MKTRKNLFNVLSLLLLASMLLAACGAPATEAPTSKLGVGIVLPTKDEPRWIQDETRFKDALTAKGYDVEILFSQGDSAKEKANVESLITKGIKVLILTPQDGAAAAAAADAARAAGVKVISYDRLILNTDAVEF